jgi:alpha-N-arabinofuranosidase
MKDVDRSIQLVVCGSCTISLPTYLEWDRQVLEYLGDQVDYISLHRYVGNHNNDTPDYLAVTNSIDRQIEEMDATCRYVQARRHSRRRPYLCFDEWNVWYKNQQMDGEGKRAPHLVEEIYNLEDALVVAGFLNSFIRHADVVKIANLAQIVNVIAPIQTRGNELLIQSTFYPFEMFSSRREGISLQPVLQGPTYTGQTNGTTSYVDVSAILAGDRLHLFAVNRNLTEFAPIQVSLADRSILALENAELVTGPDAKAANSFEQPGIIKSCPWAEASVAKGQALFELPPLSFVASTWRLASNL